MASGRVDVTLTGPGGGTPTAPSSAFAVGSAVGVPTGLSLTATSGLPTEDATVTFARTDPITGASFSIPNVRQWSARRWTDTLSRTVGAGEVWWFDRCAFDMVAAFFAIDIDTSSGDNDRLSPTVILTRCRIDGGGATDKGLALHRVWVEQCDVNAVTTAPDQGGCEDGWIGAAFSTVIESNIRCGIGSNTTDPHSDGVQITDTGGTAFYRSWLSGGSMTAGLQGNAAIRVGTEFGAVDGVDVFYCGFGGRSANNVQFRGDNGSASTPITNVRFRGNRWYTDGAGFLHDFQQEAGGPTMITEWTDNRIGADITVGGTPYTAGTLVTNPGA